ncbi:MAG: HIT family protein [Patescibacteria group bacterium]
MCVFCQIISGEIPVESVFENDEVFVFLDQNPVNFGDCLVTPKKHYQNIEETPVEILQEIVTVIKIIGGKIKNNLDYSGYNVVVNNGEIAGSEVQHTHWHVIPRAKENEFVWPRHKKYSEEEREETLRKLKN